MGRPSMGLVETKVRLTPEVRARIVALVGARRMSELIRQAVEAELRRRGG